MSILKYHFGYGGIKRRYNQRHILRKVKILGISKINLWFLLLCLLSLSFCLSAVLHISSSPFLADSIQKYSRTLLTFNVL